LLSQQGGLFIVDHKNGFVPNELSIKATSMKHSFV